MSFYRRVVWYFKGLRTYTRSGFDYASQRFDPSHFDIDVSGKIFLVTGANSGLGKCVTEDLIRRGGTVHMVCRNEKYGQETKEEFEKIYTNAQIYLHIVDLAQPTAVCKFAKEFVNKGNRLDVLINNAGCMVPRFIGPDGFEVNFATNSMTPYILSKLLLPVLERSSDPRVINVSSGGMLNQKLDAEDPQWSNVTDFDPRMAYAQHKRQMVVMTELLAKDHANIFYAVMHPGWADTPGVRSAMPEFYEKMKDKLRTVEQGADTIIWLAISSAASEFSSGLFFEDRQPVSTHLPLAWTASSDSENKAFLNLMQNYLEKCNFE